MKTLQNNFTTPEQSKRLLELGVPADSANCYLTRFGIDEDWEIKILNNIKYSELEISNQEYCLPCWSVGRLVEIYDICRCYDGDWDEVYGRETYIETYISAIEDALSDEMLDFSKLEDRK